MLTGQIGLLRFGTTLVAKGIEWATNSHTHHVIVAVSETECVSADPGTGVHFRPISDYAHVDWSRFVLTADQVAAIIEAARFYVNRPTPYNLAIYPPLLWQKLTGCKVDGWLARWLSRRPNENCGQLSDDIYNRAGIHLFPDLPELVTPGDFERYFKAKGWI